MNARLRVTSAKAEKHFGAAFRPFTATLADTVSWAPDDGTTKEQSQRTGSVTVEAKNCLTMPGAARQQLPIFAGWPPLPLFASILGELR
jgi:hypothetical protein